MTVSSIGDSVKVQRQLFIYVRHIGDFWLPAVHLFAVHESRCESASQADRQDRRARGTGNERIYSLEVHSQTRSLFIRIQHNDYTQQRMYTGTAASDMT